MNNIAKTALLAFLLGLSGLASAGHHEGVMHEGAQVKHIGYSQMGDPATVLEVKTEVPRALSPGEVRVKVLASPINPSDLLQISGNYGVDPVLPHCGQSWVSISDVGLSATTPSLSSTRRQILERAR